MHHKARCGNKLDLTIVGISEPGDYFDERIRQKSVIDKTEATQIVRQHSVSRQVQHMASCAERPQKTVFVSDWYVVAFI